MATLPLEVGYSIGELAQSISDDPADVFALMGKAVKDFALRTPSDELKC